MTATVEVAGPFKIEGKPYTIAIAKKPARKSRVWSFLGGKKPIGLWKFDAGGGATAYDSAGENNGTIDGAEWATGQSGGALKFNGTNHVVIPNESFFDFTGKVTVMAWMKASYLDWRNLSTIIAKGSDGNGGWALQKTGRANGVSFWVDVTAMPWDGVKAGVGVFDGQWHHVAGVYDGSNAYIYIDGGLDSNSVSCSGSIKTNNRDVYIGQNPVSMARPWEGLIDDARVYNYALSKNEVAAIYAGKEPGKRGNWLPVLIVFAVAVIVVLFAGRRKKTAA